MEELERYIVLLGKALEFNPKSQELINDLLKKSKNPKD